MPKNWKIYNLSDTVLSANTGLDAIKRAPIVIEDTGIKCLRIQDVSQRKEFKNWGFCQVNDINYGKFSLNKGEILIARTGNTIGVNMFIEDDLRSVFNNGLIRLRVKEYEFDPKFIYYHFRTQKFKNYIQSIAYGTSTQPNMQIKSLLGFKLHSCSLPEQTAIASILSTIDAKIENNLAINKTLEEMAMALYKEWFVDFGPFQEGNFVESELGMIPEGWEVKRLDKVAFKNSKTFNFKGKYEVVFVNTGDVQFGSFLHKTYSVSEGLPGQAKKVIELNDILYSEIRPKNKRYAFVDFDSSEYVVSTKFMIIRNNEFINNRLLYRILTRQETIDEFQMIAESRSGTFPQITFDAIGHFPIALPSIALQDEFQRIVGNYENQQRNNLKQNQTLTTLRDTLLPKLISGEVRLTEFVEN